MRPRLSLVTAARNDDYKGNFLWRLETALNYSAKMAASIGRMDDLEFVVVDWGSDVPIHRALRLDDRAARITRFLIVPPAIARECDGPSRFANAIAVNTGIRRSRGEFIGQTGSDILYGDRLLADLFDLLEGRRRCRHRLDRALFFLRLKNIPYDFASRSPALSEVERYIEDAGPGLTPQRPTPFLCGAAGTMFMHRDLWFSSRALDERMVHWGWGDIDLKLRICLKYSAVDLGETAGLHVYHLSHQPPGAPPTYNLNPVAFNPFVVNDRDWGLDRRRFEEFPRGEPADVAEEPAAAATGLPRRYRLRHLANLARFAIANPDRESLQSVSFTLQAMVADLPDSSIVKNAYLGLVKAVRGLRTGRKGS